MVQRSRSSAGAARMSAASIRPHSRIGSVAANRTSAPSNFAAGAARGKSTASLSAACRIIRSRRCHHVQGGATTWIYRSRRYQTGLRAAGQMNPTWPRSRWRPPVDAANQATGAPTSAAAPAMKARTTSLRRARLIFSRALRMVASTRAPASACARPVTCATSRTR
jgi:hypothetical protein